MRATRGDALKRQGVEACGADLHPALAFRFGFVRAEEARQLVSCIVRLCRHKPHTHAHKSDVDLSSVRQKHRHPKHTWKSWAIICSLRATFVSGVACHM